MIGTLSVIQIVYKVKHKVKSGTKYNSKLLYHFLYSTLYSTNHNLPCIYFYDPKNYTISLCYPTFYLLLFCAVSEKKIHSFFSNLFR